MGDGWLEVTNWDELQHYKRRNPPWIKLYARLLDNYEFNRLQDASKLHALLIWLVASRTQNHIPDDPAWIQEKISSKRKPDIDELITAGFLVRCSDASNMLASCKQNATPETETETETETEEDSSEPLGKRSEPIAVPSFPCVGKGPRTWDLTQKHLAELEEAYPGTNATQEAFKARQWLRDNPTRRKTRRGMPRFLSAWMARCQNGGNTNTKEDQIAREARERKTLQEIRSLDVYTQKPTSEEMERIRRKTAELKELNPCG